MQYGYPYIRVTTNGRWRISEVAPIQPDYSVVNPQAVQPSPFQAFPPPIIKMPPIIYLVSSNLAAH